MHELDHIDALLVGEFTVGAREFYIQQDPERGRYFWVNENLGGTTSTVLQFYRSNDECYGIEDGSKQLGRVERINGDDWVIFEKPNMTRRVVSHGSTSDAMIATAMHFLLK